MTDIASNTSRWISGIPYEVAFWESYYRNKKRRADLFRWSEFGQPCRFDCFDIDSFIEKQNISRPVIIDVGAALSYAMGTVINGGDTEIEYVDPLAPFYNRILDRYKINRPHIKFGMVENLSLFYNRGSVTFIHIRNALDHCCDPFEGIIQSLAVLKEGGILYLNHFINEAEREGYRGFHQFNINRDDKGHLILWNKSCNIDVSERISDYADIETFITAERRVVAVITKVKEIPSEMYSLETTAERVGLITKATIEYFHSSRRAAAYQWKRVVSIIGHRVMRLLPYSLLNRIKSMMGKRTTT
ncbi:MAG: hypothetical protein K2L30_01395 [Duncaniella sp.]|nr:hypothetical protein [Duncaniella sp.]